MSPSAPIPPLDDLPPFTRRVVLGVVLVLGAALRTYRIAWGLPQFIFFDSLVHFVQPAARLLSNGEWVPTTFVHPPVTSYVLAAIAAVWSKATGRMPDPGDLELMGRALTVVLSTASIAVLYLLARRLLGDWSALLAAAAFALSPLHVLEAHRTHADAGMLLLALAAAHQAVVARDMSSRGRLYVAFALAGFAGGLKYTGLASASVPAWLALTWYGLPGRRRLVAALEGALVTVAAFLVTIAPMFFAWPQLRREIQALAYVGLFVGQAGQNLSGEGWVYVRYLYPLVVAIPYMVGWPIYLAGLAGLGLIATSPRARGPVLAAVVPFFVLQGAAETVVPRYFLPLAPYLCLGAGHALGFLLRRRRWLGAASMFVVLGYTLLLTASQVLRIGADGGLAVANHLRTEAQAARLRGKALVVAYPQRLGLGYDPLAPFLRRSRWRMAMYPKIGGEHSEEDLLRRYRVWLDREAIDAVLVTSHIEDVARRESSRPEAVLFAALADGRLGFHLAQDARTSFFTETLYTWADPSLGTHLTAGILGYKLFVRDRTTSLRSVVDCTAASVRCIVLG